MDGFCTTQAQKWGMAFVRQLSVGQIIIEQKVKIFFMNRTDTLTHFCSLFLQQL